MAYYNGKKVISAGIGYATKDIPTYQATTTIIVNALTNINGRVLSAYEATSGTVTISGQTYNIYTITYGNVKLTEEKARDYMEYMTGSRFLPVYNYEKPQNSIFIMADMTFWKPQYDENNGLVLYKISTQQ